MCTYFHQSVFTAAEWRPLLNAVQDVTYCQPSLQQQVSKKLRNSKTKLKGDLVVAMVISRANSTPAASADNGAA